MDADPPTQKRVEHNDENCAPERPVAASNAAPQGIPHIFVATEMLR
jgi:hypothetical protein